MKITLCNHCLKFNKKKNTIDEIIIITFGMSLSDHIMRLLFFFTFCYFRDVLWCNCIYKRIFLHISFCIQRRYLSCVHGCWKYFTYGITLVHIQIAGIVLKRTGLVYDLQTIMGVLRGQDQDSMFLRNLCTVFMQMLRFSPCLENFAYPLEESLRTAMLSI